MGQRWKQTPADLLELREAGFSGPIRHAFNRAVFALASRIEAVSHETERVAEADGPKPPAHHHWATKPKYTLYDLLFDTPASSGDDDGDLPDVLAHLPAAGL